MTQQAGESSTETGLSPGPCEHSIRGSAQRLLHALESLSARLATLGRYAEAVEAALNAVDIEPLRESAHRALIQAHLAEGNVAEARRAFREYAGRVRDELGVSPGAAICALLGDSRSSHAISQPG